MSGRKGTVLKPDLSYLFEFNTAPENRGKWSRSHDYFVWTELRALTDPPLTVWKQIPEGVVRIPDSETVMQIVDGGTPHHIEHLFGYWRICDADIITVRSVQAEGVYYALILGGCSGTYFSDSIQWICPKCGHLLAKFDIESGRARWNAFWDEEAKCVAAFNEDPALRTCDECGAEHPLAYRFDPQHDSPAEAEARAQW